MAEFADSVTRATPYAPITAMKSFRPRFAGNSPDEYLQLVRKLGSTHIDATVEDLQLDLSPELPALFAIIRQASRRCVGLRIRYTVQYLRIATGPARRRLSTNSLFQTPETLSESSGWVVADLHHEHRAL